MLILNVLRVRYKVSGDCFKNLFLSLCGYRKCKLILFLASRQNDTIGGFTVIYSCSARMMWSISNYGCSNRCLVKVIDSGNNL